MKPSNQRGCGLPEDAIIAVALGEADEPCQQEVETHVDICHPCRRLLATYRNLQPLFGRFQDTQACEALLQQAAEALWRRLPSVVPVRLCYGLFTSVAGEVCIVTSDRGVSLVAWQTQVPQLLATLQSRRDVELQADTEALQGCIADVRDYLVGVRHSFDWSLDERFVRSSFQREVLTLTAHIPYGAVMSYQEVAAALGRPRAVRAVAQALRSNPLAMVIPCHRVIGTTGHLTGYAGGLPTKRFLLTHEGVPIGSDGMCIDKARMYVGWRLEGYYCTPHCPPLTAMPMGIGCGYRLGRSTHSAPFSHAMSVILKESGQVRQQAPSALTA